MFIDLKKLCWMVLDLDCGKLSRFQSKNDQITVSIKLIGIRLRSEVRSRFAQSQFLSLVVYGKGMHAIKM